MLTDITDNRIIQEMAIPHLEPNPLFPKTTIFIGNGLDLSLGLQSRYIDYFNHTDQNGERIFGLYMNLFPRNSNFIRDSMENTHLLEM